MRKKKVTRTRKAKNPIDSMNEVAKKAEIAKAEIAAVNNNGKKPAEKKLGEKVKRGMPTTRAIYISLFCMCCLLGIGSIILYFTTLAMIWGYLMLPFLALAYWLFHLFRRSREQVADLVTYGDIAPKEQVNGLSIYPVEKGGVIFENYSEAFIKELRNIGANPKVCVNDGKPYFVTIWDGKTLTPFNLPDQQYYDPRVFGERVLQLPAHQKLFARKQNLLQKISPFILLLVMVIEWILIITTTGETPGG